MIIEYKVIESAKRASQKLNIAYEILKSSGMDIADEVKLLSYKLEDLADFNDTILEIYTELLNEVEEGFMFLRMKGSGVDNSRLGISTIDNKYEFHVEKTEKGIYIALKKSGIEKKKETIAVFVEDEVKGAVALIDRMLDGLNDAIQFG